MSTDHVIHNANKKKKYYTFLNISVIYKSRKTI